MRAYRGEVRQYLLSEMGRGPGSPTTCATNLEVVGAKGRAVPLHKVTTERVDQIRRSLLERGLAPKTVQKAMVSLHGILDRAKRLKWIASNPAVDAERVAVKAT